MPKSKSTNIRRLCRGIAISHMSPPYSNVAKDLNLTITEPPLKKLKKKIENLPFASESQPAKLAEMASFQIQDQINFISSELSDTVGNLLRLQSSN